MDPPWLYARGTIPVGVRRSADVPNPTSGLVSYPPSNPSPLTAMKSPPDLLSLPPPPKRIAAHQVVVGGPKIAWHLAELADRLAKLPTTRLLISTSYGSVRNAVRPPYRAKCTEPGTR